MFGRCGPLGLSLSLCFGFGTTACFFFFSLAFGFLELLELDGQLGPLVLQGLDGLVLFALSSGQLGLCLLEPGLDRQEVLDGVSVALLHVADEGVGPYLTVDVTVGEQHRLPGVHELLHGQFVHGLPQGVEVTPGRLGASLEIVDLVLEVTQFRLGIGQLAGRSICAFTSAGHIVLIGAHGRE